MLISVAVIAILAAAVLPAAMQTKLQSLESAAQVLEADLALARSAAIQYNTDWSVQFDLPNNAYTLIHTGSGTPPPLSNPLAGTSESSPYRVEFGRLGTSARSTNGVRLAAVLLQNSTQPAADIRFGGQGGTGPLRSRDTEIWLSQGVGAEIRFVRLTVSWITGQVWVDRPTGFGPKSVP